jgi:peptide/nickel transport system substrate-binding protein
VHEIAGLRQRRFAQRARVAAAVAFVIAAAALGAGGAGSAGAPTLILDNSFALDTTDPHHAYDPTATIIDRAVYDTLFTFKGNDVNHPVPLLVSSWSSVGGRRFTFRLRHDAHFADGTPLTARDVVFSLRRLVNLEDNPAHVLAGFTVSATGKHTVVVKSSAPSPQLPAILATPSTGIVNSKLVRSHGGTDAANAASADKAEGWLNSSASRGAGSGPYELAAYDPRSQVTLQANPNYWGSKKPAFQSIVIRNMLAPAQLLNIRRGSHQIALDLSADQADTLERDRGLHVTRQASPWVFYAFANADPHVSQLTSDPSFKDAVRYALDYHGLVSVAGSGAIQAPGIVPSVIPGALPRQQAIRRNPEKARALLASAGLAGRHVTLEYPNDVTINGVPFATLAQKMQATLNGAGFDVSLDGSPLTTFQPKFRAGKIAFGVWTFTYDYPDPSNYFVFAPGGLIALHAGWTAGSDPPVQKLLAQARLTTAPAARGALWRQVQLGMNARSPFIPLIQPTQVFAATTDLAGAAFSVVYSVDLTQISPR